MDFNWDKAGSNFFIESNLVPKYQHINLTRQVSASTLYIGTIILPFIINYQNWSHCLLKNSLSRKRGSFFVCLIFTDPQGVCQQNPSVSYTSVYLAKCAVYIPWHCFCFYFGLLKTSEVSSITSTSQQELLQTVFCYLHICTDKIVNLVMVTTLSILLRDLVQYHRHPQRLQQNRLYR